MMVLSRRTCAGNANFSALSLGYAQPGCQATGQPHRCSCRCIDREMHHWMNIASYCKRDSII